MDQKHIGLKERKRESRSELEFVEFSVLDLETTGLNVKEDEVISIAIIPMTGLRIHFGSRFHSLIKPRKFHERTIKIHGICPGDLDQAPTFEEIYEKILDMLSNRIVVGFNVNFDIAFLKERSKKIVKNHQWKLNLRYVDIREVEGWILRRTGTRAIPSLDLSDLLHRYEVERGIRHDALGDAYITARVFQKQLKVLLDLETTPDELIQISRTPRIF